MAYSSELRKKRIAEGICGHCGKNPLHNNTECLKCREARSCSQKKSYIDKKSVKIKNTRAERLENGLCSRCGKFPVENKKTCVVCLDRQKELLRKVKDEAYAGYGGYICNCCGETTPEFLTIDHVANDGNTHRKKSKGNGSGYGFYRWIINNDFPVDLQILCYNCNCGKKHNNGICPHKNNAQSLL